MIGELIRHGLIAECGMTVNGNTIGGNCRGFLIEDERVIRPFDAPLKRDTGFLVLRGNLFSSAILKTSILTAEFRKRYLSNADDPDACEAPAIAPEGHEDYYLRIDDPALGITVASLLVMRGAGPVGYPDAPEVCKRAPADLTHSRRRLRAGLYRRRSAVRNRRVAVIPECFT